MRIVALFLVGAAAILCILEAALRVLPGPTATRTGYYFDPVILTYPPDHEWVSASGWDLRNSRRMRSNNYGFATSRQFTKDRTAVALIGDSFVEASSLREDEGLGPQLERRLEGRPVYSMGVPGSNLLDYAERVRFAAERFAIRDFVVILERGDIRQSLCGNANVAAACVDRTTLQPRIEKQAPPTRAKELLRESAAAQYLLGQLRLDPRRLLNAILASAGPANGQNENAADGISIDKAPLKPQTYVEAVFDQFAKRVSKQVSGGRLILVLDADRRALYRSLEDGEPMPDDPDRVLLLKLAHERGIEVVDLEPIFADHVAKSKLKLEVSPTDTHWNALALALISSAVADRLLKRVPPIVPPTANR